MSEKERFTVINQFSHYFSIRDNQVGLNIVNRIMTGLDAEWLCDRLNSLHKENEELKQENKKILDTINNKITELGLEWYKAEDNSKEEKEANLQLNVLEELKKELKK